MLGASYGARSSRSRLHSQGTLPCPPAAHALRCGGDCALARATTATALAWCRAPVAGLPSRGRGTSGTQPACGCLHGLAPRSLLRTHRRARSTSHHLPTTGGTVGTWAPPGARRRCRRCENRGAPQQRTCRVWRFHSRAVHHRPRAAWRENSPSQASVLQPPHDGASPTVASGAEPTEEAVGDVGGSILDPAFMDVAPHATQGQDTVLGDIGVDDAVSDVPDPLAAHHQGYGAAATDMVSGGTPGMFDADRAMAGATAESELEADGFAALEAGVDMDMDMDMDMAMDVDVEVGLQGSPNR